MGYDGWRARIRLNGFNISDICSAVLFEYERPIAVRLFVLNDSGRPFVHDGEIVKRVETWSIEVEHLRRQAPEPDHDA